jgi:alkylhydroperoxidase family enzyme
MVLTAADAPKSAHDERTKAVEPGTAKARDDERNGPPTAHNDRSNKSRPVVPLVSDSEAWRFLPTAEKAAGQPLPVWARALARSLPRTTAAMLDLDRIQRTRNPLGPSLRGKMRWVAAQANRCAYGIAYAEADLKRASLDEAGLRRLKGNLADLPEFERAALEFARKMTVNAAEISDAEVARLVAHYGEAKVAAMVLLLAYANFQDRLLLALGVTVEPGGPMSPPEIRFDRKADAPPVPPRQPPKGRPVPTEPERIDDPFWLSMQFDELQDRLTGQRSRSGRIRVPTWEEVVKVMPPTLPRPEKPVRIRWSLVCMGYQPELAAAWSACTRAFREEAKQDRVFEESLFWIVTRTIDCFY